MGAKASKAKQAKDRQGKLAKLAKNMEAAKQLISGERYRPRLKIAEPPSCGELPLALRDATLRHQQATQDILSSATLPISKGMRLIIRGTYCSCLLPLPALRQSCSGALCQPPSTDDPPSCFGYVSFPVHSAGTRRPFCLTVPT